MRHNSILITFAYLLIFILIHIQFNMYVYVNMFNVNMFVSNESLILSYKDYRVTDICIYVYIAMYENLLTYLKA